MYTPYETLSIQDALTFVARYTQRPELALAQMAMESTVEGPPLVIEYNGALRYDTEALNLFVSTFNWDAHHESY